jgi:hypothetical protein
MTKKKGDTRKQVTLLAAIRCVVEEDVGGETDRDVREDHVFGLR